MFVIILHKHFCDWSSAGQSTQGFLGTLDCL